MCWPLLEINDVEAKLVFQKASNSNGVAAMGEEVVHQLEWCTGNGKRGQMPQKLAILVSQAGQSSKGYFVENQANQFWSIGVPKFCKPFFSCRCI
jgi:hypothetical protein